jgi:hypothetical protein
MSALAFRFSRYSTSSSIIVVLKLAVRPGILVAALTVFVFLVLILVLLDMVSPLFLVIFQL